MRGRSRSNQENIIILAHQIASFSRRAKLKNLSEYLPSEKPSSSPDALIARLQAAQAKGLVTITERKSGDPPARSKNKKG